MGATQAPGAGPLAGIRVLELGSLIAGPFAGRVFADFGAEVIKIENPAAPDPMRDWGRVRARGRSMWWAVQSRNKRFLGLDLKEPRAREAVERLVATSDVLIENFRPGTLERLGLGPDRLWEINPGLIIARVSGYGQTGSRAHLPGYAAVAEAASGLRHMNGYPDQPPPRTGISLGDSLASLYAVQGVLMALYWRDVRGGTGQVVDVSLVEASYSMLEGAVAEYAEAGVVPGPSGSRLTGIAPSNIYRSAEGKWVAIGANQDTVFARLCAAMGRGDLAEDPRFAGHVARGEHQDELDDLVAAWAATLGTDRLIAVLEEHGVPTSTVNSVEDIFADPMFREREMLVEVPDGPGHSVVHPGIVPRLSATPGAIRWSGPAEVGADTASVLDRAGAPDEAGGRQP